MLGVAVSLLDFRYRTVLRCRGLTTVICVLTARVFSLPRFHDVWTAGCVRYTRYGTPLHTVRNIASSHKYGTEL